VGPVEQLMTFEEQEAMIRDLTRQMVKPIIDLARQNIEVNANKNKRLKDLQLRVDMCQKEYRELREDLDRCKLLQKNIQALEKAIGVEKAEVRGRFEGQDQAISRL
jgi:hypothetical protein